MKVRGRDGPPASEVAPLRHPAVLLAVAVAAAAILVSVSFAIFDPDLFQHLLVGKVIWETHGIPRQHLWSWPSYGTPEVLPSWLFRALAWPFWQVGQVEGLFAWRWLTTLAAFGLVWATARRMGARGLSALVVLVLCSLVYRQRSQVRPETLVAVLLALQLWILETRRHGGPDRSVWLVAVAWAWANAHLSYYLGLIVLGLFWADDRLAARSLAGRANGRRGERPGMPSPAEPSRRRRRDLGAILLASAGVSFLNPFGWRALWQPFEYFLFWRHELIFRTIGELRPIQWGVNVENGLPLLLAGWPALLLWRAVRVGFDRVEAAMCALFSLLILFGQRFLGFYALVAVPYVARDLAQWLGVFLWPARIPLWGRAAMTGALCVTIGIPEWTTPSLPLGVRLHPLWYPEEACDFIEANGVRGRAFTDFALAGYLLYRFWPDRARLPFMDIHQTGSREDREACARLTSDPGAWAGLDRRHRFDYALQSRKEILGRGSLDALDADSAFALVFVDDVAALYVRRQGPLGGVAERNAYRLLPAGGARLPRLQQACATDSVICMELAAELERSVAGSPRNSQAQSLLANVALARGRLSEARSRLRAALAVDPNTVRAHERLGLLALLEGNPREALREFREERRRNGALRGLDLRMGQAYRRLGDSKAAERFYRRELRRDPAHREARDSLAAIGAR